MRCPKFPIALLPSLQVSSPYCLQRPLYYSSPSTHYRKTSDTPSVPDADVSSIDHQVARAEKLALPGFEPGSSTYRVAALTTMLQDWTDEIPEISRSAIDMKEQLELVSGFHGW